MKMDRQTIGERLRTAREAIPASLHEVARDTKVRLDYLQAMERDSFRFVSTAYARGMLRSYGRWLRLDDDELIREYDRLYGSRPTTSVRQIFKEPAQAPPRSGVSRWAIAAAGAALLLLALSVAGIINPDETRVASPPTAPRAAPTTLAQAPEAIPPIVEEVRLTVTVVGDRAWLRVVADGAEESPLYQGTLTSGATRTFEAKDSLQILFGNLGGVRLELNGRDLGVPGRPGQTGTLIFTPGAMNRLPA